VFDLLGRNEVYLTAAVGWVLSESPVVLTALTQHIGLDFAADEIAVALEVADEEGRTDIELTGANTKVVIGGRCRRSRPPAAGRSVSHASCAVAATRTTDVPGSRI
jgi:hypothetical protein